MIKDLGPLDWRVPIVDGSGRPSPEFQRRWNQQRSNNGEIPAAFTQLSDVPQDYTGAASKLLQVKPDESGLQYVDDQAPNLVLAGPASGADSAPAFRSLVVADLPSVGDGVVYANISGGVGAPTAQSLSAVLDYVFGNSQGGILYRGASGWSALGPGTAGQVLQTNGAGANPSWAAGGGGGSGSMTLIQETLPSGTGVVTFSAIPATYRDIQVVIRGRGAAAATSVGVLVTFNNDTAANYEYQRLSGSGNAASAAVATAQTSLAIANFPAASATAGISGFCRCQIGDYAGTSFWKSGISDMFGFITAYITDHKGVIWHNTAAINRVDVTLSSGNWAAGSVVSLYGIL